MTQLIAQYPEPFMAALSGLLFLIGYAGRMGMKLIHAAWLNALILRVGALVATAVRATAQELTNELKEASMDGTLTSEEAADAKARAWAKFKTTADWRAIVRALGLETATELVNSSIEAEVLSLPRPTNRRS